MTPRIHSSDATTAQQSLPDRWAGNRAAGCRHSPRDISRDRRSPATRACRGTLTGAREKVVAQGSCAPAGLEAAAPCQVPGQSGGSGGWERSGNHGRSSVRSAALFCSPVRGLQLRKHESAQVAGIGMHSWGSRRRRFKSGRPDQEVQVIRRGTGFLARAPFRSSGANRGATRRCLIGYRASSPVMLSSGKLPQHAPCN